MPDWQITAKTVFCDGVDDEVTWLVYRDGTTRCTGCLKYGRPNDVTRQLIRAKTRCLKRPIRCEGEKCPRISDYKDQIFREDAPKTEAKKEEAQKSNG
jgi:hypothetical protein